MRLLILLTALTGCAAPQAAGEGDDQLAPELAGREAGEAQRCVQATASEGLTIIARGVVSYRSGGTLWVNRLERQCPSLRPGDTLVVEVHGSQYCSGDRVRALQAGSPIPGPTCLLGDFTPYRRSR